MVAMFMRLALGPVTRLPGECSWKKAKDTWLGCGWLRPWSKDFPGTRQPRAQGFRLANRRPIGSASGCVKAENKRCRKADMDTQSNCEGRCARFWKRHVG